MAHPLKVRKLPGRIVAYLRVSTALQSVQMQRDAAERFGATEFYEERASGADITRYNLNACLEGLKEGDTLVVYRLDRLGRSLPHLIEIMEDLGKRGVHFVSITENIDTRTAAGKMMFHIIASFAEFERNLISERVKAGLDSLRLAEPDRQFGRPPKLTPIKLEAIWGLFEKGKSVAYIAQAVELSESSVKRAIKAGKEAAEQEAKIPKNTKRGQKASISAGL